ncbi:MAG: LuxR family transcriptional regulator [Pseudomonadales bacterium]|nr:LuxR family transcriptional regulator [Pseudomonadales bacterium]
MTELKNSQRGNKSRNSDLARLSGQVASLLEVAGTSGFIPQLAAALREWVAVDEICLLAYPQDGSPEIHYREAPFSSPGLDAYVAGPFLLDPYYVAAARHQRFGFFSLAELAPSGFRKSEYYRDYYRFNGLSDECGYLIAVAGGTFINLSLARNQKGRKFTLSELRLLDAISASIGALVKQHFIAPESEAGLPEHESNLRSRLELTLSAFGDPVLTPRERQVIQAVLHGHSTKSLALELGISLETVKLHRKNAYRKLSVRSQSELFQLFIKSFMNESGNESTMASTALRHP